MFGGAVITTGNTSLGINDAGQLNFYGLGPDGYNLYGVWRTGMGDATSPGCPCEGWGAAVTASDGIRYAGWANQASGSGGYTDGVFGSVGNTASSRVRIAGTDVVVTQNYGPSLAPDLFMAQVTVKNTSLTDTFGDLVYRRAMDWDIPPHVFDELVTHVGVVRNLEANGGKVRYASNNGFASSDPRSYAGWVNGTPYTDANGNFIADGSVSVNADFDKLGVAEGGGWDHGSVFDFAFGDLAPGDSKTFNIFYGSAANKPSAPAALRQVGVANADGTAKPGSLYSLGPWDGTFGGGGDGDGGSITSAANPDDYATFMFAFGGVGEFRGGRNGKQPDSPLRSGARPANLPGSDPAPLVRPAGFHLRVRSGYGVHLG